MADLLLVCSACGRETKVSEFVEADRIPCPGCGVGLLLVRPASAEQDALGAPRKIAVLKPDSDTFLSGRRRVEVGESDAAEEVPPPPMPRRLPGPSVWGGVLVFFLCGGLLVGLQYGWSPTSRLAPVYAWVRLAGWGLAWALVLAAAYEDSPMQGLACLFFPPYALYYIFSEGDSYPLRGLAAGLLLAFVAEFHFMGSAALGRRMQARFTEVVESGEGLLRRAGE